MQLQIVKGWFLGDGTASKERRSSKITTVSKNLALDMLNIFHRNFIVPSVDIELRSLVKNSKQCDAYNIALYGDYAEILYHIKYVSENLSERLIFPLSIRRAIDIPILYQNKLYLKSKIESFKDSSIQNEKVYCLKMPHEHFLVNGIIVHNCRGYRSEEYPDGIDVDEAQYISSLVPQERGFIWPLNDLINGNPDKDRKPQQMFIKAVNQYPGLLDIMLGIEGLICRRGIHASGVIFYDQNTIFDYTAVMRAPNGNLTTQWDLH